MLRRLNRIGPWLLVAALAWYLAGCFIGNKLENQSLEKAKSLHKNEEHFDTSNVTKIIIRTASATNGESYYFPTIKVVFDPTLSQAAIKNEDISLSTNSGLVDGVLDISLEKSTSSRHIKDQDPLTVSLPPSIHQVGFAGTINASISGSFPDSTSELNLEIIDNKANITVGNFKIHKLVLTSKNKYHSDNSSRNTNFILDKEAVINDLDVSMADGELTVLSDTIPQHIQLNLADTISIKANAAFLQAARFTKAQ